MRLINIEHLEMRLRELGWFEPDEFDTEIKLKCILDYEPTAYDVDKVVERLEKMRDTITHNIALNSQEDNIDEEILNEISHYQKIIQIVKSGEIE